MARYRKEEILDSLRQFEEEFDHSPTKNVWNKKGFSPHSRTIERKFGSWNKALDVAGLDLNRVSRLGSKIYSCTRCEIEFQRSVADAERSKNVFCSQSCSAQYYSKCSSSGFSEVGLGTATTSEYSKVNSGFVLTPNFCLGCGGQITTREQAKYCSLQCQQEHRKLLKISEVVNDPRNANRRQLKKTLIYDRGYRCGECYRTKWNGEKIPIEIDHIDGNSDNNSFDNLRLICPNCHAQTPTYKAKNMGNGRHSRRVRYAKRKSY